MDLVDALWHGLNFLWPAIGTAVIAASAVKVLWRHELRGVLWRRLAAAAAAAGVAASVVGLVAFAEDGRMATYGMLVLAETAALGLAMQAAKKEPQDRNARKGQRGQARR